ncbi:MAG: type IV pilus modification protein PilV [Pseudomonadota bacterium]
MTEDMKTAVLANGMNMSCATHPRRGGRRQSGFTLVEVLVALLILAIGLLGLATLQTVGIKFNQESYLRSQAVLIAYDIIDRIRANPAAKSAGSYNSVAATATYTAPACSGAVNCSVSDIATYDLANWKARIAATLPMGTGAISTTNNRRTVTITWKENDLDMSIVVEVDL